LPEYQAALNGITVDSFVFVEVGAHDEDGLDEARWVSSLGKEEPRLGAIVAQARLERGAAVREELDQLVQLPLVHGVRRILAAPFQHDLAFCLQPAFLEALRLLPEYGFSFDIGISAVNLPNVVLMVQHCPDVRFILNHIGKPLIAQGVMEPWSTQFRQLAAFPQVSCKVSGLLTEAGPE
jgi:L-fuconolactonase